LEHFSQWLVPNTSFICEDRSCRRFHQGSRLRNRHRNHRCSRCPTQWSHHYSRTCYWNRIRYDRSENCTSIRHNVGWLHRRRLEFQEYAPPVDHHHSHRCYRSHRCHPCHRSGLRLLWGPAHLRRAHTIQGCQRAYPDSRHGTYIRHNCRLNTPEALHHTQESNPQVSNSRHCR